MSHPRKHARAGRRTLAVASLALAAFGGLATAIPATAATTPPSSTGDAARNGGADITDEVRQAIVDSGAKNVILLIGDGMGDSEITVARNYHEGAGGRFAGIDAMPLTGQYTTYSLNQDGSVQYVTDSAASGTGWSTGTKTYNGAIGVDVNGDPVNSLLEYAKANGKKTGNVSTAEIEDATPAAEIAHVTQRKCYGPNETSARCASNALENGGSGSIAEQLLDVRPDVTLGGGAATFTQTAKAGVYADMTLWEQAEARGYQTVTTAEGLDAVTEADAESPVLGLFTDGNFPTRYAAAYATSNGGSGDAVTCQESSARLSTKLSLSSLTEKAIGLLDNEDGFFLQVEGASIDKRDHSADACGQIGETVDLDEAVKTALDFAKEDGDTLVIVTADHAHTSQIVENPTPGLSIKLRTADGDPMIVSYGTSPEGGSQQHTGTQVRIAAYGPGAANVVGLTDQTDTFFTVSNTLGLTRDLGALSEDATASVTTATVPSADQTAAKLSGMDGDWVAEVKVDGTVVGQVDVLTGASSFVPDAALAEGEHTVTFTGRQTGTTATATFTVDPNAQQSPGTTGGDDGDSDDDGADDAAAATSGDGGSGRGGLLATTGAQVLGGLLLAGGLVAGGAGVLMARRRHAL